MKIRRILGLVAIVAVMAVSTVGCASSRGQGKTNTNKPGKKDTEPTPVAQVAPLHYHSLI